MGKTRQSDGSTPSKRSVVCLTKYIPYPGIAHAGGEYLQAHLAVLRESMKVDLLAPETPLNREALALSTTAESSTLLSDAHPRLRGLLFRWFQVEATLAGCQIYWPIRRLFRGEQAPWQQLTEADAIELQWSEMISLAPLIRRRLPDARLVGVAHDISTQRWQRKATEAQPWIRRAPAKFVATRTRRQEAHSFAALDTLIVFSDKDAQLAKQLAPAVTVEVVHPGFKPKTDMREPDKAKPIVLFVGAMNRPENQEAALWFVENIWPTILAEVPAARFVVAGANPPAELAKTMSAGPNTELTGFVDSLEPWYAQAAVCVVPLRNGAGVKFKTIDAMISGVPVVTTTVGAEGIAAGNLFVAVTDDPVEFARATIAELTAPNTQRTTQAKVWASSIYGEDAFAVRLKEVYERVWSN